MLFAVSTTGQGDVPDKMTQFWRVIRANILQSDVLSDLTFAAFGLGDSSYAKFNWAVKKVSRRLLQLGARELIPYGQGDDQHPQG